MCCHELRVNTLDIPCRVLNHEESLKLIKYAWDKVLLLYFQLDCRWVSFMANWANWAILFKFYASICHYRVSIFGRQPRYNGHTPASPSYRHHLTWTTGTLPMSILTVNPNASSEKLSRDSTFLEIKS